MALDGQSKKVPAVVGVPIMIREIYQTYNLPMNPDTLGIREICFWYNPLIKGLVKMQQNMTA